MKALVSVIVPAYNAGRHLRQTLESVCAQTHQDIEVIVIDDGSRDNTRGIADELAAKDRRVRLLHQDNAGVGAARNTGIREARGVYIAPLDADDVWHPRKLEAQVACMEMHGETTGLVYCWTNMIDSDGHFLGHFGPVSFQGRVHPIPIKGNFTNCASVPLFRVSALTRVGNYITRAEQNGAQGCEDWDLLIRIAEHYEVHFAPAHLVGYRQGDGMSLSTRQMMDSFKFIQSRARQRSPRADPRLFRIADAAFCHWLGERSYDGGNFGRCIALMVRAVTYDFSYLLNQSVYRMLMKSAARLIIGRHFGRRLPFRPGTGSSISAMFPPFPSAGPHPKISESLFSRIQAKRLESALQEVRETGRTVW